MPTISAARRPLKPSSMLSTGRSLSEDDTPGITAVSSRPRSVGPGPPERQRPPDLQPSGDPNPGRGPILGIACPGAAPPPAPAAPPPTAVRGPQPRPASDPRGGSDEVLGVDVLDELTELLDHLVGLLRLGLLVLLVGGLGQHGLVHVDGG